MEQSINFEDERKRLTRWAWGVTGVYGCILTVLASLALFGDKGLDSFRIMSPNEVGDLLAGIAGPLAFIWLVYGYFLQGIAIRQQAEELAQNTRALHLQEEALRAQALELKNAVEQQRELVDVSRKQFEAATEASRYERERDADAIRPIFILDISNVRRYQPTPFDDLSLSDPTGAGQHYIVESFLSNQGNVATEVSFVGSNHLARIYPQKITSIQTRERTELHFLVVLPNEGPYLIEVRYMDAKSALNSQTFKLKPRLSQAGNLEWLESSKQADQLSINY